MSYNPVQKSVGYALPGRFYDFSIIIESQQACGNKIEIEIIIDDRLRSEFVAYSVGNSTKKTVRLTDYDRDRSLKYAILSLPSSAREVTIECLDDRGPIAEQCCTYDLYGCSFKKYSDPRKSAKHGKSNEGGASLTYGGNEYQDSYQKKKSSESSQDHGFLARLAAFTVDITFLVIRCYLGAMIARNMGFKKLEHLIAGAVMVGLVSEHTLGNTVSGIFSSTLIKLLAIFSPVCVAAYFAVQPAVFHEVMSGGIDGIINKFTRYLDAIQWQKGNIEPATLWATASLMLLGVILSAVISKDPETDNENGD